MLGACPRLLAAAMLAVCGMVGGAEDYSMIKGLYEAAANGDHAGVNMWLKEVQHVDTYMDGITPLMIAARNGHEETVKVLIAAGAVRTNVYSARASS